MLHRLDEPPANPRAKAAFLGFAGSLFTVLGLWLGVGAIYIWIVTGVAPHRQVMDAGWVIGEGWLLGGLFAFQHLLGVLLFAPRAPWGVAGATLGLGVLWVLAARRAWKGTRRERT